MPQFFLIPSSLPPMAAGAEEEENLHFKLIKPLVQHFLLCLYIKFENQAIFFSLSKAYVACILYILCTSEHHFQLSVSR